MTARSLEEWLRWQETLHPQPVELKLDRVRAVAVRLSCPHPDGAVFTVAGTNGKGSTVALVERFLLGGRYRVGAYTSPHLVRYNERIRVDGRPVDDDELVAAFERVDSVRGDISLTFFEFGTLAAFEVFRARGCDAWVLEVGMGGRLDAVNVVDPDFALITTIGLDHQQFLGDTVEEIAAEKAGILRAGRPGFYGDWPVPRAIRRVANERGAELRCLGERFDFTPSGPCWSWRGQQLVLDNLSYPSTASLAQLRNTSLALAAIEQFEASLIADAAVVNGVIAEATPPGRFQVFRRDHEWILDVAHNPQAATTLRAQLDRLEAATETTVVLGMLGDKSLEEFIAPLRQVVCRWVVCTVDDQRACPAGEIAARMRNGGIADVLEAVTPDQGLALARDRTAAGGRIIVCGSFRMVGPALWWLGIY